jgi:hypothetical protein
LGDNDFAICNDGKGCLEIDPISNSRLLGADAVDHIEKDLGTRFDNELGV